MARIKKATDASGNVFYPVSISKAVWDTDRTQRVSGTLTDLYNTIESIAVNSVTGELTVTIYTGANGQTT